MEQEIDYKAVITQLQLENEMLRRSMGFLTDVHETVYAIPNALERLWQKATKDKYNLLIAVMIAYWCISLALAIYDRVRGTNP